MMRMTLITVLVLAGLCGGCQSALTHEQKEYLWNGEDAYARRQYASAVESMSQFVMLVKNQPELARAYYVRGLSYAQLSRRAQAYSDLKLVLSVERADPETVWRSYVTMGSMLYEDGEWDAAAQALHAAARRMPNMEPRDVVLYRLGVSFERTGQWGAARNAFEELVTKFPSSNQATAARRRLELSASYFAIQVGVYQDQRNAEIQISNLRKQNISTYVRRELRDNRNLYVVLVGKFDTWPEAQRRLSEMKTVVPDAIIWP